MVMRGTSTRTAARGISAAYPGGAYRGARLRQVWGICGATHRRRLDPRQLLLRPLIRVRVRADRTASEEAERLRGWRRGLARRGRVGPVRATRRANQDRDRNVDDRDEGDRVHGGRPRGWVLSTPNCQPHGAVAANRKAADTRKSFRRASSARRPSEYYSSSQYSHSVICGYEVSDCLIMDLAGLYSSLLHHHVTTGRRQPFCLHIESSLR